MKRARQWLIGGGIALGVLGLGAVVAVKMIPSDEELKVRAAAELEAALGVPVSVGALHWQLLPSPRVTVENVVTTQTQPIEVKKLTAYLNTSALWQRRLKVARAELDGGVVPQLSLRGLGSKPALQEAQTSQDPKPAQKPSPLTVDELPLAQFAFREVTWISRTGVRLVLAGEVAFDAGWRPRTAQIRRPDITPPADLTLTRQGQEDRWDARVNLGGGTANGALTLTSPDKGGLRLSGTFKPQGIEVSSALRAMNQRAVVAGKASGDTTLSASGDTAGELARSLHTTTSFTMGPSSLLRFDMNKAIRSLGKDHAGKTPLDGITGQLDTQNTAQGMVISLSRLKTSSGVLSASGQARIANRQIDAEFSVDLVDGVIGIPIRLSGPLDKVQVSVPAGALAGAAAGTVVLPGIGTAIGARIGAALEKIFGAQPEAKKPAPPPAIKH